MTCLDCSLYMRSEKNGPHQSVKGIDSIVCIKYGKKKNLFENHVDAMLALQCIPWT